MLPRKNIISFSSGKDSTALLLLAIERNANPLPVFADTGHEHQLVYEYLTYIECVLGIKITRVIADFSQQIARKKDYILNEWPKKGVPDDVIMRASAAMVPSGNPFLDLCIWKGRFPSMKARFCTEELKVNPITEQVILPAIRDGYRVISWQGVRADESLARRFLPSVQRGDFRSIIYRPILRWTVDDVFAFHKKHGIEPNPLYKLGMSRVGCMPCINARKSELAEIAKRFPDVIERVAEWERIVAEASKRGFSTLFTIKNVGEKELAGMSDEDIFNHANIREAVAWAATDRGGLQFPFDFNEGPSEGCSSQYGLCE